MSILEDINNTTDKASDIGERYIKTSRQYFKLKVFQQLTLTFSMLTKAIVIGGLALIGIVFMSIALAIRLGEVFDSATLGYLAVGFIFIVMAMIIYAFRIKINTLIIKTLSLKFFD